MRSLVAPLVALAAVGVAYLLSIRVMSAAGQIVDISVPAEIAPIIVALLFGVVTDYVLFFVSRLRRHLRARTGRTGGGGGRRPASSRRSSSRAAWP